MALMKYYEEDAFAYQEPITSSDDGLEEEARARFSDYQRRGVILNGEFEDEQWRMTNEVIKQLVFDFSLNCFTFAAHVQPTLGCSYEQCGIALRIYVLFNMTYSLRTVQLKLRDVRKFVNSIRYTNDGSLNYDLPNDSCAMGNIIDFLEILPCANQEAKEALIDEISEPFIINENSAARKLSSYRSYFRFAHYLEQFWAAASPVEKLLYFPIWLWWELTSVIPLRVTEFCLIPRQCLREEDGVFFLSLRRTRLKRENGSARHNIRDDYEVCEYRVPLWLAQEIDWYISQTNETYSSEIDSLIDKGTQFELAGVRTPNDRHYSMANLKQLLHRFYEKILCEFFSLRLVDDAENDLAADEIELIRLGDTRHIAIMGLMFSGNSVVAVQELARHTNIDTGANYYSSACQFLDAILLEQAVFLPDENRRKNDPALSLRDRITDNSKLLPISGGRCANVGVANGNFSACEHAVSPKGAVGECRYCAYYHPDYAVVSSKADSARQGLETACFLLINALDSFRKDQGNALPLTAVIEQLQASCAEYLTASCIERQYWEEHQHE